MQYLNFNSNIEVQNEYDVIVSGAGPAGFCAALQAGRMGSRTALIERYGMPGGAMTVGGVTAPSSFHSFGEQIISGIGWELIQNLISRKWAERLVINKDSISHCLVNPVAAAHLMDLMLLDAGVDVYYDQNVCDVIKESNSDKNKLNAIIISTKSGLKALKGKVFIDCTGDGDISAWSGASYEIGDQVTGDIQPGSLTYYIEETRSLDNIDKKKALFKYEKAIEEGRLKHHDYWGSELFGIDSLLKSKGRNINHIVINGADSSSRTRAEIEARTSALRIFEWMRTELDSSSDIKNLYCAPETWPRESRRILGDTYITIDDYKNTTKYADAVCYYFYAIDIHQSSENGPKVIYDQSYFKKGKVPTIPMSSMYVKGFDNLLTAGRCISGDRMAHGAYRVQASCMAMGQAAGVAASLASCNNNVDIRSTHIDEIKNILKQYNAIVP